MVLETEHHGAGAVYYFKGALRSGGIGCRRLPMCSYQDGCAGWNIGKGTYFNKAAVRKTGEFRLIMHDGTKGIQPPTGGEKFLRPGNGPDNSATEAGARVCLNL